jgi:uncharacterized protein YkwD
VSSRGIATILGLLVVAQAAPAVGQVEASLTSLRAAALAAVNRDRSAHALPSLRPAAALDAAAQAHAEDMLRRSYFSHISPEGGTVGDRFASQGGSIWRLVEENIAACSGCSAPPTSRRVSIFQRGLMQSPEHRENILRPGITQFGYGIAGAGDRVYAVQVFTGPGAPRGSDTPEVAETLSLSMQAELALREFNAARRRSGLPPIGTSRGLTAVASKLVSNDPEDSIDLTRMKDFDALSDENGEWEEVRLQSRRCGGCGVHPTAADVVYFANEFLRRDETNPKLLARGLDAAGFAMTADGKGMKSAVLLLARRRR